MSESLPRPGSKFRVDLGELVGEFYQPNEFDKLGQFVPSDEISTPASDLLCHEHHMTVTVEDYHGGPVSVRVHRYHHRQHWYLREITLHLESDGSPVQYGIVRFDTTTVSTAVWQRIESRSIPLGRVLINHDVHRRVELCRLWTIDPGPSLRTLLRLETDAPIHGRTALIHCNGRPAIELLEVVTV